MKNEEFYVSISTKAIKWSEDKEVTIEILLLETTDVVIYDKDLPSILENIPRV